MKDTRLQHLISGAQQLGVQLTDQQANQLDRYVDLLQKWNKAYNLTAVRDRDQMVIRHLFDSFAIAPFVEDTEIVDVGSGAGIPGIPLAIIKPSLRVTTLDSNSKKTRFQNQVKIELDIENLEPVHSRVEQITRTQFPQVIARAFASIQDMIKLSECLLAPKGVFLAMKGRYPVEELASLPTGYLLLKSHELRVPELDEERHLLVFGRA